jgi:hypothetical protein
MPSPFVSDAGKLGVSVTGGANQNSDWALAVTEKTARLARSADDLRKHRQEFAIAKPLYDDLLSNSRF